MLFKGSLETRDQMIIFFQVNDVEILPQEV
jgi:hypothetical protein